jgi:Rieske Fe-S protein
MSDKPREPRRRGVLLGAGAAGISGALAGCSLAPVPYDSTLDGSIPHDEEAPTPTPGPDGKVSGIFLASTSDIPVGGGTIFPDDKLVVTQPVAGEFKAFSVVCTHVGCLCDKVVSGTIQCPCHGSTFRITDGGVVTGPATRPLAAEQISVTNGKIMLV